MARGFSAVDHTGESFIPGQSRAATRLALAGDVLSFQARVVKSKTPVGTPVLCSVRVRVYDATVGTPIWEHLYASNDVTDVRSFDELFPLFGRTLWCATW